MFNAACFLNSRPDGFAVLQIVAGPPKMDEAMRLFVPLRRTELEGEIAGPLAALRITHHFRYEKDACDRVLEALYRFPLPGDAAVTSVTVQFGSVRIEAELKERKAAEAAYEDAKSEGRQAALLSRESPDVFTLSVAGLRPDEDIAIETRYVQLAKPEGVGWSLRIPLTTSPRYTRSDERGTPGSRGQPLGLLRDPGHKFSIDFVVRAAAAIRSETHRLDVTNVADGQRVRLRDREVVPDRDCVVTWEAARVADRAALHVLTHVDAPSGKTYFLALVAPPSAADAIPAVPREVVLLVDHSGSMEGAKWAASDWAVRKFLRGLQPRDALALGLFHNQTSWWRDAPEAATAGAVKDAETFLLSHRDSGGTDLGVALEQAVGLKRAAGERARHLLIVTDAEVTDDGRIIRLAEDESARKDSRRISVLCIDAAPNSFLAHELADRGGGVARFLTSAPEDDDITTALDDVLEDWAEPVLAGLSLEIDRAGAEAPGHRCTEEKGRSVIDLGDLPRGRAVWVAGRFASGKGPPTFRLRARGAGAHIGESKSSKPAKPFVALKPLFGARRVLALEFLMASGRDPGEVKQRLKAMGYDPALLAKRKTPAPKKVYAENQRGEIEGMLREILVQEALDYGLASSATSFVAVRKEKGKRIEGTVAVFNALPSGWSEEFLDRSGGGGGRLRKMSMHGRAPSAPLRAAPPETFAESMFLYTDTKESGGPSPARYTPVYRGVAVTTDGERVLLDTNVPGDAKKLAGLQWIHAMRLSFPKTAPAPDSIPSGLALLIYVDDLSQPRARVRVVDVIRQGGERPLNIALPKGARVRIVLADPDGNWASSAPKIELTLG